MYRRFALLLAAAMAALALIVTSAQAATTLRGTVGPGFTIKLTKAGTKVTRLKAGSYRITVSDRSSMHDFFLRGPGLTKRITGVDFTGTKTVTVRLRKGTYTYVCTPHASSMRGSFRVF